MTSLNLTCSPCCCYVPPHLTYRPPERWQLVYCLRSSLCCHGPLGNILQVNWHLTGFVWCGKEAACWESPISSGGRAPLVWWSFHSFSCPPPPSLSPCVSPPLQPACTPDRQTDAICRASPALGLYHSPQTAHCLHTGCKFCLPLSL